MNIGSYRPRLTPDSPNFANIFNRQPTGLSHNISGMDMFRTQRLLDLSERYAMHPEDYFVAGSAPSPGTTFYDVRHGGLTPRQAIEDLDQGNHRVLMKRPEKHDPEFRKLLDELFSQVKALSRGVVDDEIVRLESAIFVSSSSAITPFHFDPEIAFFFQIEGEKTYHVYMPQVLSESELERFYVCGIVNIGQVQLAGRDPMQEYVFHLGPGKGLHQPRNSPHWVETRRSRSISYSFVFETAAGRSLGQTRAFNHYLRKLKLQASLPGRHPVLDALKARTMDLALPIRDSVRKSLHMRL